MPPVPNETNDEPVKLAVYDFSDGARLKMTAADAARYQEGLDKAASDRAAWEAGNRGETAPAPTAEPAADVVPLTILSKAELVDLAKARGLATSGSKDAIAARFVEPAETDDGDGETDDGGTDGDSDDDEQPPA